MNGDDGTPEAINLIDLIDRLVEPPPPAPIPMTPQTAGWAVLALLLALVTAWLAWRAVGRWRANAYRRAALTELEAAGDALEEIAAILRRTALAVWPREQVASLTGSDWLSFLDATGGGGAFSGAAGEALLAAPYRERVGPVPELRKAAALWIRRHRVEGAP